MKTSLDKAVESSSAPFHEKRSVCSYLHWHRVLVLLMGIACIGPHHTVADDSVEKNDSEPAAIDNDLSPAPAKIEVKPEARDEEIVSRLQNVLEATNWFSDPHVRVENGVVFLRGRANSAELKAWASDLARNTQDVVAVANRMDVAEPAIWDFSPAWQGLFTLWRDFVRSIPFIAFGCLILLTSLGAGIVAAHVVRKFLRRRIRAKLLLNVLARGAGTLVVLFGVYVVLRVAGLTQLALTVVGGTGLIGLAFGIAFRDITENFLASIFLSMQRPFATEDLIEVSGVTGYVQQLNIRTTIIMRLDGILVQIPNATVYKSNISNFTANTNRREDFVVGIGYDDSINDAQEIARTILSDHPAVLSEPEPSALVESLGGSTVNLRIYFWLNGREHSWLKVRSSVIRLVKRAFQNHGISMPDEAREVVFPDGVPVTMLPEGTQNGRRAPQERLHPSDSSRQESDAASTKAEAGLYSESEVIDDQARRVMPLKEEENLLRVSSDASDKR